MSIVYSQWFYGWYWSWSSPSEALGWVPKLYLVFRLDDSCWIQLTTPPSKKTKHDQHGVHLLYLQGSRVLHLHPTHVDLGAVDFQKSLPYTKQAPPCYDMLQPCFLIDPKKKQFCRRIPSLSGLPPLTTVMSWTAQLSLVASVEGGISYSKRVLDI